MDYHLFLAFCIRDCLLKQHKDLISIYLQLAVASKTVDSAYVPIPIPATIGP